jgi:hypothetical protein
MVGDRVTVHLNDTLVVRDVVMENYWERGRPIYPRGPIELQHHGAPLYFKNIYLREIATSPRARTGTAATSLNRANWHRANWHGAVAPPSRAWPGDATVQ